MNDPTKVLELALLLQSTISHNQDSEKEDEEPSLLEHVLHLEESSEVGRVCSENVHTRNDCEDEREAEEEERMAIKILPVESAETIPIGAGSELFRLKGGHVMLCFHSNKKR